MKDAPAYDQIIQGLSGVMSITGDERLRAAAGRLSGRRHARRDHRGLRDRRARWCGAADRRGSVHRRVDARLGARDAWAGSVSNYLIAGAGAACRWATTTSPPRRRARSGPADGLLNIAANKQEQFEALAEADRPRRPGRPTRASPSARAASATARALTAESRRRSRHARRRSGRRCSTASASRPGACSPCPRRWSCRRSSTASCCRPSTTFRASTGRSRSRAPASSSPAATPTSPMPPPDARASTPTRSCAPLGYSGAEIAALPRGRRRMSATLSAEEQPCRRRATGGDRRSSTSSPGKIAIRGYPIQELIGTRALSRHDLADAARRTADARRSRDLLEAALVAGGRPRAARAVDRDRAHGGDLRAAAQRRDGLGDQRARRRPRRRRPAVHGALPRDRRRSRRRTAIAVGGRRRARALIATPAARSFPASATASIRSIRAPRRCSRWSRRPQPPASVAGRFARDRPGRSRRRSTATQGQPHPDEHRRRHGRDLLRARLRAGARPRPVHPVALGRHPRPRLGAEAAGPPHQGADAARRFRIATAARAARRPTPATTDDHCREPAAQHDLKETCHERLDLEPAGQVPRGARRRAHLRPVRPHQHRRARRRWRRARSSSSTRATSRSPRTSADGYARATQQDRRSCCRTSARASPTRDRRGQRGARLDPDGGDRRRRADATTTASIRTRK